MAQNNSSLIEPLPSNSTVRPCEPFDYQISKTKYFELVNKTPHKKLDREYFNKITSSMLKNEERIRQGKKPRNSPFMHYELLIDKEVCLIKRREKPDDPILKYLALEDSYDVLIQVHTSNGHATPDIMREIVSKEYIIKGFYFDLCVLSCNTCCGSYVMKKSKYQDVSNQEQYTPTKINEYDRSVDLEIIRMGIFNDGNFHLILVYKYRWSSFTLLRPLIAKCDFEIATELFKIITSFGPPEAFFVIEGDFRFYTRVLDNIKGLGINCKIPLRLRPTNNKYEYIFNCIREWMTYTGSSNWGIGCHAVQWNLNNNEVDQSFIDARNDHYEIGIATPHESLFDVSKNYTVKNTPTMLSANSKSAVEELINLVEEEMESQELNDRNDVLNSEKMCQNPVLTRTNEEINKLECFTTNNEDNAICVVCSKKIVISPENCCLCDKSIHKYCGEAFVNPAASSTTFTCLICNDLNKT